MQKQFKYYIIIKTISNIKTLFRVILNPNLPPHSKDRLPTR
jgi:hypothetical protein